MWGGLNLFVTNRIKQKWQYVASTPRSQRHRASFSSVLSWITCSGWAGCRVLKRLQQAYGEAHVVRTWGHMSELWSKSSNPRWSCKWLQPLERLWTKSTHQAAPVSESQELWDNKCCFKPLNFGVICYAAIDKKIQQINEVSAKQKRNIVYEFIYKRESNWDLESEMTFSRWWLLSWDLMDE